MEELLKIINRMEPDEAMAAVTGVVKKLFPYISEKARMDFLYAFTGDADEDSVPGLVHL